MGQHILVPVDSSERAKQGFEYALEQFPDADVTVVHVFSSGSGDIGSIGPESSTRDSDAGEATPDTPGGDLSSFGSVIPPDAPDPAEMSDEQNAQALLDGFAAFAADRGAEVDTKLLRGRPDRAIVNYAEEAGLDLIVLGSHGRDGVARILLGSVAEKVVRRSPIPVLVVR
jgi:nucleotide-binding universal stress UspA family protein